MPPKPSGTGGRTESTILMYRTAGTGFKISAQWDGYVDLGDMRDMALFIVTLQKESETKNIHLGSVHLSTEDPARGQEMIKVADWLVDNKDKKAIVMGDFNWGYRKTPGVENYKGEKRIRVLHEDEDLFQLFYSLSYLGKSDGTTLQTNMNFRASGYFYDQFLTTPILAMELADGGNFLEDCGILAFDLYSKQMRDAINYWKDKREYGLRHYLNNANIEPEDNQEAFDKALKTIVNRSADDATHIISDHRIIWMQIKVW